MATNLQDLVQRLEKVVYHFEGLVLIPPSGSKPSEVPAAPSPSSLPSPSVPAPVLSSPALQAYDSQILSKFASLTGLALKIDPQISSLV